MRKSISLLAMITLLLTMVAPVLASSNVDIIPEINMMKANGWLATPLLDHADVDATDSDTGIVKVKLYECWDTTTPPQVQITLDQEYNVLPQSHESCSVKITHFVFELTNQYRPDTDLAITPSNSSTPPGTIEVFTMGQQKTEAMNAFISGLVDCLAHAPYDWDNTNPENDWIYQYLPGYVPPTPADSGSTYTPATPILVPETETKPEPDPEPVEPEVQATPEPEPEPTYQTTTFSVSQREYTVDQQKQTMDVAPYIKNDRTYVPVRYLAYSLGVEENDILWDGDTQEVGINKGDTDITLSIGSPVMQVNQKPVRMDVASEITDDRTFLPARWVAEALGAEVEWDNSAKQATIKMPVKGPGN